MRQKWHINVVYMCNKENVKLSNSFCFMWTNWLITEILFSKKKKKTSQKNCILTVAIVITIEYFAALHSFKLCKAYFLWSRLDCAPRIAVQSRCVKGLKRTCAPHATAKTVIFVPTLLNQSYKSIKWNTPLPQVLSLVRSFLLNKKRKTREAKVPKLTVRSHPTFIHCSQLCIYICKIIYLIVKLLLKCVNLECTFNHE